MEKIKQIVTLSIVLSMNLEVSLSMQKDSYRRMVEDKEMQPIGAPGLDIKTQKSNHSGGYWCTGAWKSLSPRKREGITLTGIGIASILNDLYKVYIVNKGNLVALGIAYGIGQITVEVTDKEKLYWKLIGGTIVGAGATASDLYLFHHGTYIALSAALYMIHSVVKDYALTKLPEKLESLPEKVQQVFKNKVLALIKEQRAPQFEEDLEKGLRQVYVSQEELNRNV